MVDSGASVHMMSKSDLIREGKTASRKSKESCSIITANGSITATEEATVHVRDLDICITVHQLDDAPVVLSRGNACEERGYSFEWKGNQSRTLTQMAKS